MQEGINKTILSFLKEKNINLQIENDYNKTLIKTNNIVIDAELLKEIINSDLMKKSDYDYCNFITQSCRFFISDNNNDIDLNFSYLLTKYYEKISSIYNFISIFQEIVKSKKINLKEPNFTKYNTNEIKVFSKFLLYCINKKDNIDFDNFIYIKYFDLNNYKDEIKKKELIKNSKILELVSKFGEILKIFDEIYDTKLFSELSSDIIEYDIIENNKLFITQKGENCMIQIIIRKEFYKDTIELIKKIKKEFKDIEIVLFINESIDDFYFLLKEGFINNLIVKNSKNKNLLMLKSNKDIFIYYDNEYENSFKILENQFNEIKKILNDYFETLYFIFNIDYKIHKIKINLNLSNFGFFIKDKIMQNYFTLSEYNEEEKYYSIYLYSKNNKLCYKLFCLIYPKISKVLDIWLKFGNKTIDDNLDSLILINGFELMLKLSKIPTKIYYKKIILQVDDYDIYKNEFQNALNKKSVEFHTKNIYYVKSLKDYINEHKIIPTTSFNTYNKRGFDSLIPFFEFVHNKYPILNKKPILLQISHFLSYNLNIYGIKNELDK